MLRFLGVRHLAVIEQLEMEFEPGLNILTGETGAGKSVLMEAIALAAGGRAASDLVRTGMPSASVQAIFERPGPAGPAEFIVRREVAAQGRSRAFLNDDLVTTAALREWGETMIDLHGQHDHHRLLDPVVHLEVLDGFARHPHLLERVAAAHAAWQAAATRLARARMSDREKQARIEIARFHLEELDRVAPRPDEDVELEAERARLANADRLSRLASEAYSALYEGEHAALTTLATTWRRVAELAELDPQFAPYLDQRDPIKSSLEDLAYALRGYGADLDASPDRLQAVEDRLAVLERVKKKHGPTLADVLARQQELRAELEALDLDEAQLAQLEAEEATLREAFLATASTLTASRTDAAARLAAALADELAALAMPGCRIDLRVVPHVGDADRWSASGVDEVQFLISPNPGEELRPLARVASGGELSRIMLALHTVAADENGGGRTLVFDEVDAGIGGVAADAVGARLQALATRYQVLCVTHLPQVAARAATHFRLSKTVRDGRTVTVVEKLDRKGRELEIARMIAGADLSDSVLASARELLDGRGESEGGAKGESESPARAKAKGRKRGA
jgi:DNA repair protein RecN (Recombination protein N)